MKIFILSVLLSLNVNAQPLDYFFQFFDRDVDLTHDPDFPHVVVGHAMNDLRDVVMTSKDKGQGVYLGFSLKKSGRYSFWYLPMKHRWKNNSRQVRFGKCHAYNGQWTYKDGSLYLGKYLKLDAGHRDGENYLIPTFLKIKTSRTIKKLTTYIGVNINHDLGIGYQMEMPEQEEFDCKGFFLPIWIPLYDYRA